MPALLVSEALEADYGGVPLGVEAFVSIPAAHPSRAEIPFEPRSVNAHDARHGNATLEAVS